MLTLDAYHAAMIKQEEYDKIRKTVNSFGSDGTTLVEACEKFKKIFGHELDQSLLRELISHCQVIENSQTGRLMDFQYHFQSMEDSDEE